MNHLSTQRSNAKRLPTDEAPLLAPHVPRTLVQRSQELDMERSPTGEQPKGVTSQPNATVPQLRFTPLAYIVGYSAEDARMLSAIMESVGFEYRAFANSADLAGGWSRRVPDLILVDISTGGVDAVDTIFNLAERKYSGTLQLTGGLTNAAVEGIAHAAQRHSLKSLPILTRPFDRDSLTAFLEQQKQVALLHGPSKIELGEGLRNNWVEFWYQPKIDLRTKSLVGVESFVRLVHPQIGLISPAIFMNDASESSLFILGQQALIHAVKAASTFAELGLDLQVAINVSVKTLRTLSVARIIRAHQPNGGKKVQLTLDVNEGEIAADISFISQRLKALRLLGVNLAIDDFQSDRLSQNDLRHTAPTELKIPRLFVSGSDDATTEAMICKSIIDVAHKLSAKAVAVGIERTSQALALEQMGCDIGQGFLFGQSMPMDQLVAVMRQRSGK